MDIPRHGGALVELLVQVALLKHTRYVWVVTLFQSILGKCVQNWTYLVAFWVDKVGFILQE